MKKLNYVLFILISVSLYGCDNIDPIKITNEPINFLLINSEPAWSPDGKWIAFYHNDSLSSKSGIYLVSPDGLNIEKWHNGIAESPAWSPDGQWIAFSKNAQIWKKKLNGDSLTRLTQEGKNFSPAWSINGIVYRREYSWPEERNIQGIWFFNTNYNTIEQIYSGNCAQVTWISDESIIFFKGEINNKGFHIGTSLNESNINTSICNQLLLLTNVDNQFPRYNRKNKKIVYISKTNNNFDFNIYITDIDGLNLNQITKLASYACDWSPDGKHIVFTDARLTNGHLWIIEVDGSNKRQLTYNNHFTNF